MEFYCVYCQSPILSIVSVLGLCPSCGRMVVTDEGDFFEQ